MRSSPAATRGGWSAPTCPIVYGCSHACTFCIIPFRRGAERSRPVGDIVAEIRTLAAQGVKEITLLGQIVDRYGKDIADGPDLAGLLHIVHEIDGIERIRFLTSHPNYFAERLMQTVADLPKVMPHIEVPIQAGDDNVLANMKRGYTQKDYRSSWRRSARMLPGCSIATDIIVGFPGETSHNSWKRYRVPGRSEAGCGPSGALLGPEGTVATRRMDDNVPDAEKMERFRVLEELQERIATDQSEISWHDGRGPFEGECETAGRAARRQQTGVSWSPRRTARPTIPVTITWTGPWSMQGEAWISRRRQFRLRACRRPAFRCLRTGRRQSAILASTSRHRRRDPRRSSIFLQ